jgi:hypothetical protein
MSRVADGTLEPIAAVRPPSGGHHDLMELMPRSGRQSRERSASAIRGHTEARRTDTQRVT